MLIKSRGIIIVYKPNILDVTQHPSLLKYLTLTLAFAATDAPPERNLCNENCSLSMPTAVTMASSLTLVYYSVTFFGHNSELPLAI